MPRGVKNPAPPPTVAPAATSQAPLIILQPQADGTRIDAYGLEPAVAIDELRRALIHLVATQNGMTIISELVPRHAAVVVPAAHRNGAGPKVTKARRIAVLDETRDADKDW